MIKIVLLGKAKSNTIEILISKSLINSYISHETNLYYIKTMETYCVSCKNYTTNKNSTVRETKQNIELHNFNG